MLRNLISHLLLDPQSNAGGGGLSVDTVATIPADDKGGLPILPHEQNPGKDATIGKPGEELSGEDFEADLPDTIKPTKEVKVEAKDDKEIADPTKPVVKQPAEEPKEQSVADAIKEGLEAANKPAAAAGDPTKPVVFVPQADADKRDYSVLPQDMVPVFKAMPNNVFNVMKDYIPKVVKEANEAKAQVQQLVKDNGTPLSYFEHAEGYQLNPVYNHTVHQFRLVSREHAHFEAQIDAIEKGAASVKELIGYNERGEPQYSDIAVTDANRGDVKMKLIKGFGDAGAMKRQLEQQATGLAQQHVQRNAQAVQAVRGAAKQYFPFYEEGAPTWTPAKQKEYSDIVSVFPPELRHSPLVEIASKACLVIKDMNKALKEKDRLLGQTAQQRQQVAAEVKRSVPAELEVVAGKNGVDTLDNPFNDGPGSPN